MLVITMLTLFAMVTVELAPMRLNYQVLTESFGKGHDVTDGVKSWSVAFIGAATLPLDASQPDSISYTFNGECYTTKLDRAAKRIVTNWGASSTDPVTGVQSCPSPLPTQKVISDYMVNDSATPLFTYFSSSDESAPIADPTSLSDPTCTAAPPGVVPATADSGIAGNPNGGYVYAIAFTLPGSGESALSASSTTLTVTNRKINVSGLPNAPVGTDGKNLYRMRSGSDGKFHFVAKIGANVATYSDDGTNATVEAAASPSATVLAAGRCAKSLTLNTTYDIPTDLAHPITDRFHILFGLAVTSASLANGAVTAVKIGGSLTPDRIADGMINPAAFGVGVIDHFLTLPVAAQSNLNYASSAPNTTHWVRNTNAPQQTQAGLTFAAGSAFGPAAAIDWNDYCAAGYVLSARGRYTVLNPQGGASFNIGVRLINFPQLGGSGTSPNQGAAVLQTAITSVGDSAYRSLTSPWQVIDYGRCNVANLLLSSSAPFLYLLQTNASITDIFGVTNASIELRWQPALLHGASTPPDAAETLAPSDDSTVPAGAAPTFSGRFLDSNPDDTGVLHFQLCTTAACTTVLASGDSAPKLANGASGSWTPVQTLTSAQTYYWRVRGEDAATQLGPWSAVSALNAQ
jgi:hypothetical protein